MEKEEEEEGRGRRRENERGLRKTGIIKKNINSRKKRKDENKGKWKKIQKIEGGFFL